jgi:hypothetical protein
MDGFNLSLTPTVGLKAMDHDFAVTGYLKSSVHRSMDDVTVIHHRIHNTR